MSSPRIGIVVIGRNEGRRLGRSLASAMTVGGPVVYVDSGSSDDSVAVARDRGVAVVPLDDSRKHTAARGRNAGFEYLREHHRGLEFVQFLDGDSELLPDWPSAGIRALTDDPKIAAVCGRLRERDPQRSIYNTLCDVEWVKPVGDVPSTGGIVMMRASAFAEIGGFDIDLIAGEEPDLCKRLRDAGWRIVSIPDEMARHDADMVRFGQWWQRSVRSGFGAAEKAWREGVPVVSGRSGRLRSVVFWGGAVPAVASTMLVPSLGTSGLLFLGYPALGFRIARRMRKRGFSSRQARIYAAFTVAGKFPELYGVARFHALRLLGRRAELIEHK